MKNSKLQVSGQNFSAPTIKRLEICAQQGDVRLVMKLLNVFAVIALIIICVVQFALLNQMSESVVRSSAAHIDLKEKLEQTIESNREVLMEFDREFDRFRKTLLSYRTKESRNMAMQGKHIEKSIKTEISLAKSQMLMKSISKQFCSKTVEQRFIHITLLRNKITYFIVYPTRTIFCIKCIPRVGLIVLIW